jgi:hypothetical protein
MRLLINVKVLPQHEDGNNHEIPESEYPTS